MSPSALPSSSSRPAPIVAYLGPPGTYSHQAVLDRFGPQAAYRPCRTISDVFNYEPSTEAERAQGWHAALPFENSKNGIVLETLDLLLASAAVRAAKGKGRAAAWAVKEELRVAVRHCLVVREGFGGELGELEWVRSHEQALAQCQTFLSHSLPSARRVPMASTAGAAQSLLEPGNERGAAICARAVVDVVAGLKVVREGVEDMSGNTTRFLVLHHPASSPASAEHPSPAVASTSSRALHLYAYRPSPSDYPTFHPPVGLTSAVALAPTLRAVDRRPTGDGGSAYLVCFETADGGERSDDQAQDEESGTGVDDREWTWVGSWPAFDGARRVAARGASVANGGSVAANGSA